MAAALLPITAIGGKIVAVVWRQLRCDKGPRMCLSASDPGGPRRCSTHAYNRLRAAELAHLDAEGDLRIAEATRADLLAVNASRDASDLVSRAQTRFDQTAAAAEEARDAHYATPEGLGVAAADLEETVARTEWEIRHGRRTDQVTDPAKAPEVRTAMRRLAAAEQQLADEAAARERTAAAGTRRRRGRTAPAVAVPVRRGARPGSDLARAFRVTGVYRTTADGATTMTISRRRTPTAALEKVQVPVATSAPTVADGLAAARHAVQHNPDGDLAKKVARFFDRNELRLLTDERPDGNP